ncbi:hypothetical protein [Rubritalea tangerina]
MNKSRTCGMAEEKRRFMSKELEPHFLRVAQFIKPSKITMCLF